MPAASRWDAVSSLTPREGIGRWFSLRHSRPAPHAIGARRCPTQPSPFKEPHPPNFSGVFLFPGILSPDYFLLGEATSFALQPTWSHGRDFLLRCGCRCRSSTQTSGTFIDTTAAMAPLCHSCPCGRCGSSSHVRQSAHYPPPQPFAREQHLPGVLRRA